MDPSTIELRQQIEQTRAAMAPKIAQLEQRLSSRVAATLDHTVMPVLRGVEQTVVPLAPWLIVALGVLQGLRRGSKGAHPARRGGPVMAPPSGVAPVESFAAGGETRPRHASAQPPLPPPVRPADRGEPPGAAPPAPRPSPWKLGGLGVIELGRRVIAEIQDDDCLGRAAQLAYYFLFALFPFFLFLTMLLGYLPIPDLLDRLMAGLAPLLPGEALRLVQDYVRQLVTGQRGGLLSFGILAALWTSSSALTAIIDSLNRTYDVEEGRPFWKVRLIATGLTVGLSAFIVGSLVLLTFGPQLGGWVADRVGFGRGFEVAWKVLRWPVIVGLLVLAMALLYYFAPDVEQAWQWLTPGSAVAVLGWIVASLGFAFYVNRFGSYNATYGSIGAVIVLLTWMHVMGLFVLIGGELNAEIEHAAAGGKAPGEKALCDAPKSTQGAMPCS